MAINFTRQTVTTGTGGASLINSNFAAIEAALQEAVSRSADTPNFMKSTLDMNSNKIINLPSATTNTEPVTYGQFLAAQGDLLYSGEIAATQVQYTPPGAGVGDLTAQSVLSRTIYPEDFGVVGDGVTNDTTNMKAFFDYCIDNGVRGHIPAGNYLITAGVLVFDNGWNDATWPCITTDGHHSVIFLRATNADAAMLTISNGTAASAADRTWHGGCLGGITFSQNGKSVAPNQHGLVLKGIAGCRFGWLKFDDMGGSGVYIPEALYAGFNPDPYNVSACIFDAVEANRCGGIAFDNRNYVGLAGCTIHYLRAIENAGGVFYGCGAANTIDVISAGSNGGWAIDDGNHGGTGGGSPTRFRLNTAEIDDSENGIRLNKMVYADFGQIRFVHRWNFGVLNVANNYWPRTAIMLGAGSSPSLSSIRMNVIHRIENGGPQADIGTFLDGNNLAHGDIVIEQYIQNNTSGGTTHTYVDTDYYDNISGNMSGLLTSRGKVIRDLRIKPAVLVRNSSAVNITNGNLLSSAAISAAKFQFETELSDRGDNYFTTVGTYWYVAPYTGVYQVQGKFALAIASGTRVQYGFAVDVAGTATIVSDRIRYAQTANVESYEINDVITLNAGDRLFFFGVQNTAGPVALTVHGATSSASSSRTWSVVAV